jgi:hypothetical protein
MKTDFYLLPGAILRHKGLTPFDKLVAAVRVSAPGATQVQVARALNTTTRSVQRADQVLRTTLVSHLSEENPNSVSSPFGDSPLLSLLDVLSRDACRVDSVVSETGERKEVIELFEFWLSSTSRKPSSFKLTSKRKACLQARLRDGYTVAEVKKAIQNVAHSPFHQGQNDHKTRYDDITLICRSGDKLEQYRDMDLPGSKLPPQTPAAAADHNADILGQYA